MPARSCDRSGAAKTSSSSPVPAWKRARRWATGKPQPLAWLPGCPKWACNAGVSGMENDEPSTRKVRWPRQRPIASVSGIRAWMTSRSTARKTARGSRARAWQKAEAEKARPAISETWFKAVLPWRTWMRNQWMMAAGVKRQEHTRCVRRRGRRRG